MSEFKGYAYPVGESYGCQWPVAHGLVGVHFSKDTCGRNGFGSRLPVCWQHQGALVDAAYDAIANRGYRLEPYQLTRFLEAINRVQPFGLDRLLVERVHEMRCCAYVMDPTRVVGDEFREAIEGLLMDRLEGVFGE